MMPLIAYGAVLWGLFNFVCISSANSYRVDEEFVRKSGHTFTYDRIDEVKKKCNSVVASASQLKPDDSRVYSIKKDLSFLNGDWWQDLNGIPIMPFDSRDLVNNSMELRSPLNLVSFWVTDVDHAHRSKNWIGVSGTLQLGITIEGLFMEKPYEDNPHFDVWPGHSQLFVLFQGIYTESEKNGGERVMCLLGNTMLPSRQSDSTDPWEWMKSGYSNQPPLVQDDQIQLVLRYPKTFSLVNRVIRGSMTSLNKKSNLKYFDEIHMSSSFSAAVKYEFTSDKIVSKACDPYPYKDDMMDSYIDVYKGLDFCEILERVTLQEGLTIVPNWKCNGSDDFCSRLGPFMTNRLINATDGSFEGVKLVLQDVRCERKASIASGFTKVSSVFRVVPPFENQFSVAQRTGLNNMTLAVEGIWKASSGQLCMVGCLGLVDTNHGCSSRICLYIPLAFSIQQRSIVMGTVSSIGGSTTSYFPLSFEKLIWVRELWNRYTAAHPYYKYSKTDAAGVVLEKYEPFNFVNVVKKSLLQFPKIEYTGSFLDSLSLLSEDLTLHVSAVPDPFINSISLRTDLELEIISIGPLFGRHWSSENVSAIEKQNPYRDKVQYTTKQLLLNVSAQLGLTGKNYGNFSVLFLEGLYNPLVGKMYLIGCRDVRASWRILQASMDLEAGLDCLIEVTISYPPTTARWLVNPTAKISISSQRNENDPLYFEPVKLQSVPIMYRRQREDILSRRGVEGMLRILTLSLAISCLLSQLFYIRDNSESFPFISLVMLGIQALGYSLPLITGAGALFEKMASESYEGQSYDLERSQWIRTIDYTVKVLVLVAFSITMRLCQKVWRSRIRLLTRSPLEPYRVPTDKWVIVSTLTIHAIGYIFVLLLHSLNTSRKPVQTENFIDSSGNFHTLREWETELEEYLGLVQDFFLLPQVIGNYVWKIHCKPLRNFYYIGITAVRILPHVYDYVRSPVPNPYFSEEYEFVNPRFDFYSKFGDIAIPAIAILLLAAVSVQQKWSYERLTLGQSKLLHFGSKAYEKLPSVSFEAELASGVNGGDVHQKEPSEE